MDGVTTMAFTLRNLGESKFNILQDELARGKATLAHARTIRSQWGDFGDSSDTQLAMQLVALDKMQQIRGQALWEANLKGLCVRT